MSEFKLPDPKKNAGRFMGLVVLGGVGLLAWYYLVPFLLTMVWNTVSLAIGAIVAGLLAMILLSPKFWKRMSIIFQVLGSMLFGLFIQMNPFAILELQLQRFAKDRDELFRQAGKLKAQEASLSQQLEEENLVMTRAAKKMELVREQINRKPGDEELGYQLEAASNEFTNSKDFIDKVSPVKNDISRLVKFADKAHRKSGFALDNARTSLQKQRAAYEAVTAGQSAMTKALRAFSGDPEVNNAADIALRELKNNIADKIGTIKNCIAETSKLMNERDLNDAAKVAMAADNIEQLNIDQKFDYVATLEHKGDIQTPVGQNKWLETLKKSN